MKLSAAIKRSGLCLTSLLLFHLLYSQNIGIGTATPQARLDVNGSIRITNGTEGEGKVLTSNAQGLVRWEAPKVPGQSIGYGTWGNEVINAIAGDYQPVSVSGIVTGDNFGYSLAIEGDYAFVGAPGKDASKGVVYVFRFDGSEWQLHQTLTDAAGAAGDRFGFSITMRQGIAVIGAPYDDNTGTNQGSFLYYTLSGSTWTLAGKKEHTGTGNDNFGYSVAITQGFIMVGAPGASSGRGNVHVFNLVYVFPAPLLGNSSILTDASGAAGDGFGSSVAVSDDKLLVGAPYDDDGANTDKGIAVFFKRVGTTSTWAQEQRFAPLLVDGVTTNHQFGKIVSVSGNYAAVTAPYEDWAGIGGVGALLFFRYNPNTDMFEVLNTQIGESANNYFAGSVSMSGNRCFAGTGFTPPHLDCFVNVANSWDEVVELKNPNNPSGGAIGDAVAYDDNNKRFVTSAAPNRVIFGKLN